MPGRSAAAGMRKGGNKEDKKRSEQKRTKEDKRSTGKKRESEGLCRNKGGREDEKKKERVTNLQFKASRVSDGEGDHQGTSSLPPRFKKALTLFFLYKPSIRCALPPARRLSLQASSYAPRRHGLCILGSVQISTKVIHGSVRVYTPPTTCRHLAHSTACLYLPTDLLPSHRHFSSPRLLLSSLLFNSKSLGERESSQALPGLSSPVVQRKEPNAGEDSKQGECSEEATSSSLSLSPSGSFRLPCSAAKDAILCQLSISFSQLLSSFLSEQEAHTEHMRIRPSREAHLRS